VVAIDYSRCSADGSDVASVVEINNALMWAVILETLHPAFERDE